MKKFTFLLFLTVLLAGTTIYGQKATAKPDFTKRIADATPSALPQGRVEKTTENDLRDEYLKGKVKSIVEYTKYIRENIRDRTFDIYFDPFGDRTKEVKYVDGYPSKITVWGYINGVRVYTLADVPSQPGDLVPAKSATTTEPLSDMAKRQNSPKGLKYPATAITGRDDQGRVVETSWYQNTGEKIESVTYTYNKNVADVRDFDSDGKEESRNIYVLDASGNRIEQLTYRVDPLPPYKYIIEPEFDAQGNWIVERIFHEKLVNNKTVRELRFINYRTIVYYP